MRFNIPALACLLTFCLSLTWAYSALEDERIIAEYKRSLKRSKQLNNNNPLQQQRPRDHAAIARKLVYQSDWASVGTISTDASVKGFPMVNIISINDNDVHGHSTGHIQFLLTNLDFTGIDVGHNNKTTFMFSDEQELHCTKHLPNAIDPMEPICARAMISGEVRKLDEQMPAYKVFTKAFVNRHPAAENWLRAHTFYLCELEIQNIYVLDFYGGPHNVKVEDYYNAKIEN